jgi:hypothetical protein
MAIEPLTPNELDWIEINCTQPDSRILPARRDVQRLIIYVRALEKSVAELESQLDAAQAGVCLEGKPSGLPGGGPACDVERERDELWAKLAAVRMAARYDPPKPGTVRNETAYDAKAMYHVRTILDDIATEGGGRDNAHHEDCQMCGDKWWCAPGCPTLATQGGGDE